MDDIEPTATPRVVPECAAPDCHRSRLGGGPVDHCSRECRAAHDAYRRRITEALEDGNLGDVDVDMQECRAAVNGFRRWTPERMESQINALATAAVAQFRGRRVKRGGDR